MKRILVIGLIVTLLVGCSRHSSKIEATYVSPLQFQHLECSQVAEELNRIEESLVEVVKIHDDEHGKDVAAVIGTLVLWPAALMFAGGGDRKEEISRYRGEAKALEEVAIQKDCTDVLEEIERKRQEAEKKEKVGKREATPEQ